MEKDSCSSPPLFSRELLNTKRNLLLYLSQYFVIKREHNSTTSLFSNHPSYLKNHTNSVSTIKKRQSTPSHISKQFKTCPHSFAACCSSPSLGFRQDHWLQLMDSNGCRNSKCQPMIQMLNSSKKDLVTEVSY